MTYADPQGPGRPDDKTVVMPTGANAGYQDQPTAHLAYNPYGQQFPAVDQYPDGYPMPEPARRPAGMVVALLLHVLSALPFLAGSAFALIGGASVRSMLPPEQLAEFESVTGVQVDDFFALLFGLVVLVGVASLLFVIFAVLAFARRNWARIMVTIMTVPFAAFAAVAALGAVTAGANDPATDAVALVVAIAVVAGPGTLALVGTVLLFLPRANRFFATRRR
ncbi:MAG: hypothetical protein ACT4RN_22965 [Pseudonocardia sp.]